MRLPPCHMLTQVFVDDERRLTLLLYQRSCDFPVGVIANIQFYSALAIMIAQQTDCKAHEFVHVTGDSHIYEDQIEAVKQYLALPEIDSPKLEIKKAKDIFSYQLDDFVLTDFNPGPKLEIPVAV
jgi:thymidylate synthase